MRRSAVLLCCLVPALASAAINPAEYTRGAPYQLQLRPQVQIVQHAEVDGGKVRRTTIVATVVQEHRDVPNLEVGDTVTIDWTVDLDAQARARKAHDDEYGTMPGPQFLHAPLPPTLDADGLFWANLEFDEHARPHPGLVSDAVPPAVEADHRFGEILVPASHQYTWDRPEGAVDATAGDDFNLSDAEIAALASKAHGGDAAATRRLIKHYQLYVSDLEQTTYWQRVGLKNGDAVAALNLATNLAARGTPEACAEALDVLARVESMTAPTAIRDKAKATRAAIAEDRYTPCLGKVPPP